MYLSPAVGGCIRCVSFKGLCIRQGLHLCTLGTPRSYGAPTAVAILRSAFAAYRSIVQGVAVKPANNCLRGIGNHRVFYGSVGIEVRIRMVEDAHAESAGLLLGFPRETHRIVAVFDNCHLRRHDAGLLVADGNVIHIDNAGILRTG